MSISAFFFRQHMMFPGSLLCAWKVALQLGKMIFAAAFDLLQPKQVQRNMMHPLNQIWGNGHAEPISIKLHTEPNLLNLFSIELISQKSSGLISRIRWSELIYQNFSYLISRIAQSELIYQIIDDLISNDYLWITIIEMKINNT